VNEEIGCRAFGAEGHVWIGAQEAAIRRAAHKLARRGCKDVVQRGVFALRHLRAGWQFAFLQDVGRVRVVIRLIRRFAQRSGQAERDREDQAHRQQQNQRSPRGCGFSRDGGRHQGRVIVIGFGHV